jgi:hypothetical protein
MSMQAISSFSNTVMPQAGNASARIQDRRAAFGQMSQSMQSGDLSGARSAYASLVRNAPPGATMQPGSPFAQLGQALASGDMSSAQTAWSTMVQDRLNGTGSGDGGTSPTPISTTGPVQAFSTSGSLNVTA